MSWTHHGHNTVLICLTEVIQAGDHLDSAERGYEVNGSAKFEGIGIRIDFPKPETMTHEVFHSVRVGT